MGSEGNEPQRARGQWRVWAATLLFFAAFYALMIPLPLYLEQVGLPDWQVGLILGALGFASLVSRPLAGAAADAWGRRPVLLFGAGALAFGAVGSGATTAAPVLFGLRMAQAVGYVAFTTAATALVSDLAETQRRAAALALFGTAANLAMTLTPAAVSAALDELGLKGAFWLSGILAAVAGLVTLSISSSGIAAHTHSRFSVRDLLPVLRRLRTPLIATALFGVGFGAFLQFLPLLTERRGLGVPGVTYSVYGVGIILTRLTVGRRLDAQDQGRTLSLAFLVLGAGLTGFALAGSRIQLILAALLVAVGGGILHPLLIALHVNRVAPDQRGRASAAFYVGFDLGIGTGTWLLAPVLEGFGLRGLYIAAAAAALMGMLPSRALRGSVSSRLETASSETGECAT
jgi:MFS family permease